MSEPDDPSVPDFLRALAKAPARRPLTALPQPGERLGRLEVRARLGVGGMGAVLRAFDPALQREVAVKVLRATGADERARLQHEARLLAQLRHPNVAVAHELVLEHDTAHLVMELVEGESLRQKLQGPTPEATQVLRWLRGLASALVHAHAQGVVHRDVKPENVLVDAHHESRLVDFGLAQSSGDGGPTAGTPGYLAPEVVAGGRAGPEADVFAFGVLLRELVARWPSLGRHRRALESLARRCTAAAPMERPSAVLVSRALESMGAPTRWPLLAAAAVVAAAVALLVATRPREPAARPELVDVQLAALGARPGLQDTALSNDGTSLSLVREGGLERFDVVKRRLEPCPVVPAHLQKVTAGPDGERWLLTGAPDAGEKALWVLRADGGLSLRAPALTAYDVALSPDGHTLAVSAESTLELFDVRDGGLRSTVRLARPSLGFFVGWSPDARSVLVLSESAGSALQLTAVDLQGRETSLRAGPELVVRWVGASAVWGADGKLRWTETVLDTPPDTQVVVLLERALANDGTWSGPTRELARWTDASPELVGQTPSGELVYLAWRTGRTLHRWPSGAPPVPEVRASAWDTTGESVLVARPGNGGWDVASLSLESGRLEDLRATDALEDRPMRSGRWRLWWRTRPGEREPTLVRAEADGEPEPIPEAGHVPLDVRCLRTQERCVVATRESELTRFELLELETRQRTPWRTLPISVLTTGFSVDEGLRVVSAVTPTGALVWDDGTFHGPTVPEPGCHAQQTAVDQAGHAWATGDCPAPPLFRAWRHPLDGGPTERVVGDDGWLSLPLPTPDGTTLLYGRVEFVPELRRLSLAERK